MPERTIAIRIDDELHKKIKIRLVETSMTLKDYIISLIQNDLSESTPIKWKATSADATVNEDSIKEAQKVLDFVNDVIRLQGNGNK